MIENTDEVKEAVAFLTDALDIALATIQEYVEAQGDPEDEDTGGMESQGFLVEIQEALETHRTTLIAAGLLDPRAPAAEEEEPEPELLVPEDAGDPERALPAADAVPDDFPQ